MRKNCIFHVDFEYKNTFSNPFCHIQKVTKTLIAQGFFEFFTKFSTVGGKLFLQVEKFSRFFCGKEKLAKETGKVYARKLRQSGAL